MEGQFVGSVKHTVFVAASVYGSTQQVLVRRTSYAGSSTAHCSDLTVAKTLYTDAGGDFTVNGAAGGGANNFPLVS